MAIQQEIDVTGTPTGGEVLAVTVNGNPYSYTFKKTDTVDSAVRLLIDVINSSAAATSGGYRAGRSVTAGSTPALIIYGCGTFDFPLGVAATVTPPLSVISGNRISP